MAGTHFAFGILLIVAFFVVAWAYDEGVVGFGYISLPIETALEDQPARLLTNSAGAVVANVSLLVLTGSRVVPGEPILFEVNMTIFAPGEEEPFFFIYEIVNANSNQSFLRKDEGAIRNGSFVLPGHMTLPDVVPEGNYLLLVNASVRDGSVMLFHTLVVEREITTPWLADHFSFLMSALTTGFVIFAGLYYVFWLRRDLLKKQREEKQKNSHYPLPDFLTLPQSKYAHIGLVADADEKAYLDHTQLNRHTLIAGGTGSGKTVAGMVISEELLKRGVPVIVFDPVGQWTGFAKPNADERMRMRYRKFELGMPRAFNPRVIEISDATMHVNVLHYLFMKGITVFRLDHLTPRKVDEFIERALLQIYQAHLPESGSLKTLVVLDEVHRLLPKYGGRKAYTRLEQAVREFRKWGVGLLMISQVLTDFKGAIRGNIGTEIQVHTRYEGDIKRVRERHGAMVSNLISKLPTGLAMIECADYNRGNPYFVEFRPLLHNPYKLTDKEARTLLKKDAPVLRMDASETSSGTK